MAKITLLDGTVKRYTLEEFNQLEGIGGMIEAFKGKPIINVEFYEEDGK